MSSKIQSNVALSAVHSFATSNNRVGDWFKSQEDLCAVALLFMDRGWDASLGITIAMPMEQEAIAKAVADREARREKMLADKWTVEIKFDGKKFELSTADLVASYDAMYMDGSKVIKPRFERVSCHRRGAALVVANALRARLQMPLILDIPVQIEEGLTPLQRHLACLYENTAKLKGSRPLSTADYLNSARLVFWTGGRKNDLRKAGVPAPQKVWALVQLDHRFKSKGIVDALIKGDLDFERIDKEKVRTLAGKANISESELEEVLTGEDRVNRPKMASYKDLETLMKQTPVDLLGFILEAVIKNKLGDLAVLTKDAKLFNEAFEASGLFWSAEPPPAKQLPEEGEKPKTE